jgi:hypothetical protein
LDWPESRQAFENLGVTVTVTAELQILFGEVNPAPPIIHGPVGHPEIFLNRSEVEHKH